jgi:hypothetical protein
MTLGEVLAALALGSVGDDAVTVRTEERDAIQYRATTWLMNRGNDKKYPVNAFLMKKVMKYVVINKWS